MRILSMSLLLLFFLAGIPAGAKMKRPDIDPVPVERLLTNLQVRLEQAKTRKDKAMIEFQIGRLHQMAYARNTNDVEILPGSGDAVTPYYGWGWNDYKQFDRTGSATTRTTEQDKHLDAAITHLKSSLSLDPTLIEARLGLAWSLDQLGKGSQAIIEYRNVLKQANESGPGSKAYSIRQDIWAETASYLLKLLNPTKDATEISQLQAGLRSMTSGTTITRGPRSSDPGPNAVRGPRPIRDRSPIVVPVSPAVSSSDLIVRRRVIFDVDGFGKRCYSEWPSAAAGWLVYDERHTGKITSGLQLFGNSTFWIFWNNGYDALATLDDNHNGIVDGPELDGLALWCDTCVFRSKENRRSGAKRMTIVLPQLTF